MDLMKLDLEQLQKMIKKDKFIEYMGIEILEIGNEKSKVKLKFGEHLINFFGAGHGGAIYCLADTAFQLACNASPEIELAVALSTNLNYIKKVEEGETLIAEAEVISSTRRTSITDIKIKNENQELVAVFKGLAYLKRKK